ncbi:uncharacterized protein J3R85_009039 [Psidium guajava]|nr:uncharacterized protein J3R85_009039 [Psidium guajava]
MPRGLLKNELIISDTTFHTCSSHAVDYSYQAKKKLRNPNATSFPLSFSW